MKRLRMISDAALARLRQNAAEAWRRQNYSEYFRIMENASRQDPANSAILLDMGAAYGARYEYAAAERCFEKAVRVSPARSDVLVMAGTQCRGFDRYEMARHYFERAIKEPKVSPDTFVKLAEIYERFRLLEDASELVERALRLSPGNPLATLVGARLDRLSGRLEQRSSACVLSSRNRAARRGPRASVGGTNWAPCSTPRDVTTKRWPRFWRPSQWSFPTPLNL
jgi:tetratricopeptide (TPR) repeat protein